MSNPLVSLKKSKKPPLFLPDVFSPTPSSSSLDMNKTISSISSEDINNNNNNPSLKFNMNIGFMNRTPMSHKNSIMINNNNNGKISVSPRNYLLTAREDDLLSPIKASDFAENSFSFLAPDHELIDEVTTKFAQNNFNHKTKSNFPKLLNEPLKSKIDNNNGPSNIDLMQIMMKKMKYYEAKCNFYEKDNRDKEKKIKIMEEKLKLFEKMNDKVPDKHVLELETKCLMLEQQVFEMEKFLSDYGLRWVGEKDNDDEKETSENKKKEFDFETFSNNKFVCKYDLVIENIKELNILVNDGEQKIIESSNGARFQQNENEKVRLVLYENGICLFNGPFRSFSDFKTQQFCTDIMDGYFPSELQNRYPDGVSFEVIDKREVYFKDQRNKVFESEGYRLGTKDDDNYLKKRIETDLSETKLTINQFLKKLPTCVVRNGNIANVREEISDKLKDEKHNNDEKPKLSIVNTTVLDDLKKKYSESLEVINEETIISLTSKDIQITTLKVKCDNNETYILKMKYSDTIKEVKNYIKKQRKNYTDDFDLVSIYPHKVLNEENSTLEQLGLVPNSSILMVIKQK